MENYINFDLNELINDQIKETINTLNKENTELQQKIFNKNEQKKELEQKLRKIKILENFIELINKQYDSKKTQKEKYDYIESLMFLFFNIGVVETSLDSNWEWFSGPMWRVLAINYYNNRDELIQILSLLNNFHTNKITYIRNFKMPIDYSKEEILNYVKNPKYNTNSVMIGISKFYFESNNHTSNIPHDLLQANKYILEDDVFKEILITIQKQRGEWYVFCLLDKYNNLSNIQIQQIGELLTTKDFKRSSWIKEFVLRNMSKFNDSTIDKFYLRLFDKNLTISYKAFPSKYKYKFLKDKGLEYILKEFEGYHCNLTIEEKNTILRNYYKEKDYGKL